MVCGGPGILPTVHSLVFNEERNMCALVDGMCVCALVRVSFFPLFLSTLENLSSPPFSFFLLFLSVIFFYFILFFIYLFCQLISHLIFLMASISVTYLKGVLQMASTLREKEFRSAVCMCMCV